MRPRQADCRTRHSVKVVGKQFPTPLRARDRLALPCVPLLGQREKRRVAVPPCRLSAVSLSRVVLQTGGDPSPASRRRIYGW